MTGIDVSERMLEVAKRKVQESGLTRRIRSERMSIVMKDRHVPSNSYDKVLSTFVFSELSENEQRLALRQSHRVLKPHGKIILLDEVIPASLGKKILYYLVRIPFKLIAYLFAQTTTRPLGSIEEELSKTHFRIEFSSRYLFDSLQLIVAVKEEV